MNRQIIKRQSGARGWVLLLLMAAPIGGCVEESLTPAVFDVVLESTTFENRLRAPVIIFRDNVAIDTMRAGSVVSYPLGRRGAVRHAWRLISPFDASGAKAGEEPRGDLGVQFQVNQLYRITNDIPGTGETIFTPLVSNGLSFTALRLAVNIDREDQRVTNYLIPARTFTNLDSAPYYYWNSNSNVLLTEVNGFRTHYFHRDDTLDRRLRLDDGLSTRAELKDAGVTEELEGPMITTGKRFTRLGMFALGLLLCPGVHAQDTPDGFYEEEGSSPLGVAIGFRGGIVLSTARGIFPSIIVTDSAISTETKGSGDIPQSLAETGLGSRFGMAVMIPFSEKFGLGMEFGLLRYAAQYKGDATRQPTRLEAQTLLLGIGGEYSFYTDPRSYRASGLRSVYAAGGLDIALATLANRVESTRYTQSGEQVAAVGTFNANGPFNSLVGLRAGVGIRFAADPHFEIMTEASYGYALNTIFSKESVPETNFTVDNMGVVLGVGYRF